MGGARAEEQASHGDKDGYGTTNSHPYRTLPVHHQGTCFGYLKIAYRVEQLNREGPARDPCRADLPEVGSRSPILRPLHRTLKQFYLAPGFSISAYGRVVRYILRS